MSLLLLTEKHQKTLLFKFDDNWLHTNLQLLKSLDNNKDLHNADWGVKLEMFSFLIKLKETEAIVTGSLQATGINTKIKLSG